MVKKKYIILAVLLVYTVIIFLPPLMHSYVYPNNGDDTAFHLIYFDTIASGEKAMAMYLGRDMVGFPLVWINQWTGVSIDALFLWFNFVCLWLIGIAVFVLISRCIDWKAGLLAIPIVVFCTPATLGLFDTGAIFDLATVAVIVPLLLWCGVRLVVSRKLYWAIPTAVLGFLSVALHTMRALNITLGIGDVAIEPPMLAEPAPSIVDFSLVLLGYVVALLLLVVVIGLAYRCRNVVVGKDAMVLIGGMGVMIAGMSVLAFTDIVTWAQRIAIDLAIVVAIFASCLLGVVLNKVKKELVTLAVCVFVIAGSLPIMTTYFQYNSAVKQVDMETIAYVNNLPGGCYSCSPEVAHWIYGRFLNKEYSNYNVVPAEIPYIHRNLPMTSMTSPDSRYYWWKGLGEPAYPLEGAIKFKEGEVEISVVIP